MIASTLSLFALVSCSPSSPTNYTSFPSGKLQAYLNGLRDHEIVLQASSQATAAKDAPPAFYRDGDKLVYDMSWLHDEVCSLVVTSIGEGNIKKRIEWPMYGTFGDGPEWHTPQHVEIESRLRAKLAEDNNAINLGDADQWPYLQAGSHQLSGLTGTPIIYIISLPGALPRRHRVAEMVKNLDIDAHWRWMPAVNGRAIPNSQFWANQSSVPAVNVHDADKGKYGAYLSHQMCLEECSSGESDVIIMEDDNVFHPDFVNKWNYLSQTLPFDWDVALLGSSSLIHVPFYETKNYIRTTFSWGAYAYIVRGTTVPRMLRLLQTNRGGGYPYDIVTGQFNMLQPPDEPFVTVLAQHKLAETNGEVHSTEDLTHKAAAYREHAEIPADSWNKPYMRPYCADSKSSKYCTKDVEAAWQQMLMS